MTNHALEISRIGATSFTLYTRSLPYTQEWAHIHVQRKSLYLMFIKLGSVLTWTIQVLVNFLNNLGKNKYFFILNIFNKGIALNYTMLIQDKKKKKKMIYFLIVFDVTFHRTMISFLIIFDVTFHRMIRIIRH